MKFLLVNPPYPRAEIPSPPLGLAYIAAALEEEGYSVQIQDFVVNRYTKEKIEEKYKEYEPDIVGTTAVTMTFDDASDILKYYKEESPDIFTVIGGPHVTFDAVNTLKKHPHIDMIVMGEGERTIIEIADHLKNGKSFNDIKGISFRENGGVTTTEPRPLIQDMKTLPYPARHLLPLNKYQALDLPITIITSRGCPHKCIFCVGSKMVGGKVRFCDSISVVDEIEMVMKEGFKKINIVDDLFTANKKHAFAVCDEIMKRGIEVEWGVFARVDTVTPDLLNKMREAGCSMLLYGVESGSQEILDKVKKKITIEKCVEAVKMAKEAGMVPMASFILGLPGETLDTVDRTLKFGKELSASYGFHLLAPFPGTEVRERAEEYGIKILTDDWRKYDANCAIVETEGISAKQLDQVIEDFNELVDEYYVDLKNKYKEGTLEESDIKLVTSATRVDIIDKMIQNEFLERQAVFAMNDGERPEETLPLIIQRLQDNTDAESQDIRDTIEHLYNNHYIVCKSSENKIWWEWKERL